MQKGARKKNCRFATHMSMTSREASERTLSGWEKSQTGDVPKLAHTVVCAPTEEKAGLGRSWEPDHTERAFFSHTPFSAGRPKPRSLYKPTRLLTLRAARLGSWREQQPSAIPQGPHAARAQGCRLGTPRAAAAPATTLQRRAASRRRGCHSSAAPRRRRRSHVGRQAPPTHVRAQVGGRTGLPRATSGRLPRHRQQQGGIGAPFFLRALSSSG